MLTSLKMREVKTAEYIVCDQVRAEAKGQVKIRVWIQIEDQVEIIVIHQVEDQVKWLLLDQIERPR